MRVRMRLFRSSFMPEGAAAPMYTRLRLVPPELATYMVSFAAAVRDSVMPHGCDPTKMPFASKVLADCCQTSIRFAVMFDAKTLPRDWSTTTSAMVPDRLAGSG